MTPTCRIKGDFYLDDTRQYEESLRKLRLEVYMFGKRIANVMDDPFIRPSMNVVAATYELAQCLEAIDIGKKRRPKI